MTLASTLLPQIGVEAIVAGIKEFQTDMLSMNKSMKETGQQASFLERAMKPVNDVVRSFGNSLKRVAEIALGIILAGTLKAIARGIANMAKEALKAGAEFQRLFIRLQGIVARDLPGEFEDFGDKLAASVKPAKDLFFWIQKLAFTTPFDIAEIANIVTLGKAFFDDTEFVKEMTEAVVDFTAGMGLGDEVLERIIFNFGQMAQQGKITGTELRDLGRGAFVPINDLLDRTAEKLGVTSKELADMRKKGLAPVMPFMEAFIEMVGEDFPGAAERMSGGIEAALGNVLDLIQGLLGFNIVRPILDEIADRVKNIVDVFSTEEIIGLTESIGASLATLFSDFLKTFPGAEDALDTVRKILIRIKFALAALVGGKGLEGFLQAITGFDQKKVDKILELRDNFLKFKDDILEIIGLIRAGNLRGLFEKLGVPEPVIKFFESVQRAIENFKKFWDENKDEILGAFTSIFESLGTIGEEGGTTALETLGRLIEDFSEFILANGPMIAGWFTDFATNLDEKVVPAFREFSDWFTENKDDIFKALLLIGEIALRVVITLKLLGFFIKLIAGIGAVIILLPLVFAATMSTIGKTIKDWVVEQLLKFEEWRKGVDEKAAEWSKGIGEKIDTWATDTSLAIGEWITNTITQFSEWGREVGENIDTWALETADIIAEWINDMLEGFQEWWDNIVEGFTNWRDSLIELIQSVINKVIELLNLIPGLDIPEAGDSDDDTDTEGLSAPRRGRGRGRGRGRQAKVNTLAAPPRVSNTSIQNNLTLQVNSNASVEPLIADFEMLEAMAGGS